MTEISLLDRLQARLDYQALRIDILYAALEARGILPLDREAGGNEALFDELVEIENSPLVRDVDRPHALHIGTATGV